MITMRALASVLALAFLAMGSGYLHAGATRPLVGVYYFPGWYRGHWKTRATTSDRGEWRSAIMNAATPRALCGFYDDSDPRLWRYYRQWMTSSEINFLAFDWYYNLGQEFLNESLDRGFLSSEDPRLRFCLHWCNHGGSWWKKPLDQSKPALLEMMDRVCDRYFRRSDYLRINGKPVFIIYDTNILQSFAGPNAVRDNLQAMREQVRKHGFPGLYLVACYSNIEVVEIRRLLEAGFDAFTAYTYAWMRGPRITWESKTIPYQASSSLLADYVYPLLAQVGKRLEIPYWPATFPGWDDRPRAGLDRALVLTGSTPRLFGRMFHSALRHAAPTSPVVMVEAWNEWGEGACIEPSKEHKFGYLQEIARATGRPRPTATVPTAEEISSWSVLSPQEIETARANESKPWPTHPVSYYRFAKNYTVPKARLPLVIDLGSDGIPTAQMGLAHVQIEERTAASTTFLTTGNDPGIGFSVPEVPMAQVKRITVKVEIKSVTTPILPELYFATGLMPEFSQFCSVLLPSPVNGTTSIRTEDIIGWAKSGTPLKRIRLDFGSQAGARVHLKQLVLSAD